MTTNRKATSLHPLKKQRLPGDCIDFFHILQLIAQVAQQEATFLQTVSVLLGLTAVPLREIIGSLQITAV